MSNDIIAMAREAGAIILDGSDTSVLERFAALVAAPLQERIADLYKQLDEAERELDSQYKRGMEAERSRQHDEIERLTNLCYEYLGELTALRAVKQTQDMMRDALTIGSAWVQDGKRLEPTSVYKSMEEDA
jgi:hypothetical protein